MGMEPTPLPRPQAGPLTLAERRVLSGSRATLHQQGDIRPASRGSTWGGAGAQRSITRRPRCLVQGMTVQNRLTLVTTSFLDNPGGEGLTHQGRVEASLRGRDPAPERPAPPRPPPHWQSAWWASNLPSQSSKPMGQSLQVSPLHLLLVCVSA